MVLGDREDVNIDMIISRAMQNYGNLHKVDGCIIFQLSERFPSHQFSKDSMEVCWSLLS